MLQRLISHRRTAGLFLGMVLTACSGGYAPGMSSTSFDAASPGTAGRSSNSEMKPLSSGQDLLYAVNQVKQSVDVYTYPQGQSVGTLTGFIYPRGECVDAAGDVFIVSTQTTASSASVISEYAHGGASPIATLSDPTGGVGCAVDQKSGNLAVSGGYLSSAGYEYGDVAVFAGAAGNPTMYYSTTLEPFAMCGYDSKGNLYVSADSSKYASDEYQLVRLPKGGKQFEELSLARPLYGSGNFPSSVQWDGKHITVSSSQNGRKGGDDKVSYLFRLSFSGNVATIIGTTTLRTAHTARSGQIWIDGDHVVGSDYDRHHGGGIDMWSYPRAREPHSVVPNAPNFAPFGIVVSHA
jgi:hypothetical protein